MNAKLTPPTPKIKDWLVSAKHDLAEKNIRTAILDSELILAHVLNSNRSFLIAHNDQELSIKQLKSANTLLKKRSKKFPIAYILGKKEFYGRKFIVDKNTLIPRPESEDIIDVLKSIKLDSNPKLIDVGTGSGCLGITAKLEIPEFDIELIDISKKALKIADKNARNLDVEAKITHSNLLQKINYQPDAIVANLPYVDKTWERSIETNFEPKLALFANNNGLALIQKLIKQASIIQSTNKYLILEADPVQHKDIIKLAKINSYQLQKIQNYILLFLKI